MFYIMDMFESTADTGFNSMAAPMNPMNMNAGAWGINSAYITPAFAAPYRPQYGDGHGQRRVDNPGFARAVGNTFVPFMGYSSGHPIRDSQNDWEAMATKPADAAAWTAQRVVLPVAAMMATDKMLSMRVSQANPYAASIRGGFHSFMHPGATASEAAAAGARTSMAFRAGSSATSGLTSFAARRIGMSAGNAAALGNTVGLFGGAAASLGLSLGLTQAAMWGANKAIFDPYMTQRGVGTDLRRNFSNISFAGQEGAGLGGQGMSFGGSDAVAKQIRDIGINDRMFKVTDMRGITDMASRAGMLDSTDISGISKKIKGITESLKTVMSVANTGDLSEAMEILSKFKNMGADVNSGKAQQVLRSMAGHASVAGVSLQSLMSRAGAQGQYLYGAAGLSPFLGQMNAATSLSAMSSAHRSGLISQAELARLGGREGATQLAMTGALNGAQTPYNQIALFNRFANGGRKQGLTNNLNAFSSAVAGDPLAVQGQMILQGAGMMSAGIQQDGARGLALQSIMAHLDSANMRQKDGTYKATHVAAAAQAAGLSSQEVIAMLKETQAMQDPATRRRMRDSLASSTYRQMNDFADQQGLGYGALTPIARGIKSFGTGIQRMGASALGGVSGLLGRGADGARNWLYEGAYGSQENSGIGKEWFDKPDYLNEFGSLRQFNIKKARTGNWVEAINKPGNALGHEQGMAGLNEINAAARSGNAEVRKTAQKLMSDMISGGSKSDIGLGIRELKKAGALTDQKVDQNQLMKAYARSGIRLEEATDSDSPDSLFIKKLAKDFGTTADKIDAGATLNLGAIARRIVAATRDGNTPSSGDIDALKKALKLGDVDENVVIQKAKEVVKKFGDTGNLSATYALDDADLSKFVTSGSKSTAERNAALMKSLKSGGFTTTDKVSRAVSNADADEQVSMADIGEMGRKDMARIDAEYKAGKIDFGELRMQEAAVKMGSAVDEFGKWVQELKGDKSGPTGRPSVRNRVNMGNENYRGPG